VKPSATQDEINKLLILADGDWVGQLGQLVGKKHLWGSSFANI